MIMLTDASSVFLLVHVLCVEDIYDTYDSLHVITATFGLNLFCLLHS